MRARKARERGDVDEDRIEDRSREFLGGDYGFDSPQDFVSYQIRRFLSSPTRYSRRMWASQPEFVLVWNEKARAHFNKPYAKHSVARTTKFEGNH